jgi:hypothetical protein
LAGTMKRARVSGPELNKLRGPVDSAGACQHYTILTLYYTNTNTIAVAQHADRPTAHATD